MCFVASQRIHRFSIIVSIAKIISRIGLIYAYSNDLWVGNNFLPRCHRACMLNICNSSGVTSTPGNAEEIRYILLIFVPMQSIVHCILFIDICYYTIITLTIARIPSIIMRWSHIWYNKTLSSVMNNIFCL